MVKRAGLRTQWLSAYAGSSPAPCTQNKNGEERDEEGSEKSESNRRK